MWAKIITIKRTKDLNYFSLCALNLFNTRVSQFELNYWNKLTFPRCSNLLRCTCKTLTLWPTCLKWDAIGLHISPVLILLRCSLMRGHNCLDVLPTYKTTRAKKEINHKSRSTGNNSTTYRNSVASAWMTKIIALMCKDTRTGRNCHTCNCLEEELECLFFYVKEIQILQASHEDCFDI